MVCTSKNQRIVKRNSWPAGLPEAWVDQDDVSEVDNSNDNGRPGIGTRVCCDEGVGAMDGNVLRLEQNSMSYIKSPVS